MSALWGQMIPQGIPTSNRQILTSAYGNRVTFANGDTVLDGDSGLWNVNLGYGLPSIAHAVEKALKEQPYLGQFRYVNQSCIQAAEELLDFVGIPSFVRVIFSSAGGAANDAVMKLARHYQALRCRSTHKSIVVGLQGSYHGMMYGSMGLSGEALGQNIYKVDSRFVRHIPANDCDALELFMKEHGAEIAAFVVEPVLGTGTVPLKDEFINLIFDLKTRYDFLLVADEVATGFGRTGLMFASQEWSLPPDVLILSKGLTNGTCATSAILVSEEITNEFDRTNQVFVHAETQACSTTSAVAIMATLGEYRKAFTSEFNKPLSLNINLESALRNFASLYDCVGSIRGRGMFYSMEVLDQLGVPINSVLSSYLVQMIRDAGALVHPCLTGITLCPSLVYTEEDLNELLACIGAGMIAFQSRRDNNE